MEPLGRAASRDNLGEGGRHNMLSALPPPPVPLGVPFFNQPPLSTGPYGHLAPLPRKPETPPLQPLPPRQPPLDIPRPPGEGVRAPSPLQQLEPVRAPSPMPSDQPRRTVQTYRKRQHEASEPRPFDFGAGHVAGMLVHPEGDVPNLPPRSGTGVRLRPARLPPCCCIPPSAPEPLVPVDPMLPQVLRMHDQRRLLNPGQVANIVVFDCVERPPRGSEPNTAAAELPPQVAAAAAAGGGGSAADDGAKRASSASGTGGAGPGVGGRISGEGASGGQSGRGAVSTDGEGAAAGTRRGSGTDEGGGGGGGGSDAAAGGGGGEAASRGAAGPPSCSYSRTAAYDYFDDMPAWYSPRGASDHTLVFESRYESGNLRRAIQVYPYEYDLILRPDINTRGHTQWFFFSVANTRAGCRYKLNIINLLKEDSLYNDGMQPLVHSAKAQAGRGLGWHRSGTRICYYANSIRRGRSGKTYFTLTFTLATEYDNDLVHVAHCYPYTYTDLQRYIRSLELDPLRRHQLRRETLATSLAGNPVDLLTITSPTDDQDAMRRRKAVVVSARVHPGESNASWMMKGLLDFLLGPSLDARMLRELFVFKVIPMLNPDGVITGNYRCSLAGVDLNRVWNDPSRKLHPVIHATKIFLKQLCDEREVVLFCDLHGHSRKRGVFMYGCEKKLPRDATPLFPGWPLPGSVGGQANIPHRFQEKLLPLLIQHNAPDLFSYHNCSFKVQKSKGGTSRVVGFRELGLVNSFTVEASFAGPSSGRWARQHFTTSHLEQQGAALMTALLDYWDPEAYGYGDLLGQLDFMHPSSGEAPPRFITTPDGQMVEVEDDEPPTDSDDESSDDGGGGGRGPTARARTASSMRGSQAPSGGMGPLSRDAQGSAFMQQYYNTYGMSNGANGTAGGGGGLPADVVAALGGRAPGDKGHSDSEVVMDPKKAKRRARLALQKALLRAEQAKATEGLAACLPLMAALQLQSPTGAAEDARGLGGEAGDASGGTGGSVGRGAGAVGRSGNGTTRPAHTTPHAIEYAKQRGVYRGDQPQWTVPGLNSGYDFTDSATSSPTSPAPLNPLRPQSPSRVSGSARLANSSNAFNTLLLSQTAGPAAGAPLGGAAGGGGGGAANGYFAVGGGGGVVSASGTFGGGRPVSPGLAMGTHRSPLPLRPASYSIGTFGAAVSGGGGAGLVAVAAAAAAAAAAAERALPPPSQQQLQQSSAGEGWISGGGGGGGGTLSSSSSLTSPLAQPYADGGPSSGYGRPLNPIPAGARSPAPRPMSSSRAVSADIAYAGAGGGGGSGGALRASTAAPRPHAAAAGGGGGSAGDGGGDDGSSLAAMAAAYSDPERLRKDREALEQRVTEAVLTTSPIFQRL